MFTNPFYRDESRLDEAINNAFEELKLHDPHTDEYRKISDRLSQMYALKYKGLSPDSVITVAGNILIGILVLRFERGGPVTSKIWTFLSKTK